MSRVIVELDSPSAEGAFGLVDRLGNRADFFKVGLDLFTAEGPSIVRGLRERGKYVLLDLKLLDVPAVVERSVSAVADAGADLLTIHVLGGRGALEAAAEAAADRLRLIGVAVLPSFSTADLEEIWSRDVPSVRGEVVRLAEFGRECGLNGIVASVGEVGALKRLLGQEFLVMTPGIRLPDEPSSDQLRLSTPSEAASAGADFLVVGRSVTLAADPSAALETILADLEPET